MERQKFASRTIVLGSDAAKAIGMVVLSNLPIDPAKPLEIVFREKAKGRGLDANARMWAGPLADIAEQGYVQGRTYTAEVWHEHFKHEYLPESFDPELCKDGYQKWDFTPSGQRLLVGSTSQLTGKGFSQYLTQIEAFGASIGVQFSASPNQFDARWAA